MSKEIDDIVSSFNAALAAATPATPVTNMDIAFDALTGVAKRMENSGFVPTVKFVIQNGIFYRNEKPFFPIIVWHDSYGGENITPITSTGLQRRLDDVPRIADTGANMVRFKVTMDDRNLADLCYRHGLEFLASPNYGSGSPDLSNWRLETYGHPAFHFAYPETDSDVQTSTVRVNSAGGYTGNVIPVYANNTDSGVHDPSTGSPGSNFKATHNMQVGDVIYNLLQSNGATSTGTPTVGRKVTAITATSITIDGAAVTLLHNAKIDAYAIPFYATGLSKEPDSAILADQPEVFIIRGGRMSFFAPGSNNLFNDGFPIEGGKTLPTPISLLNTPRFDEYIKGIATTKVWIPFRYPLQTESISNIYRSLMAVTENNVPLTAVVSGYTPTPKATLMASSPDETWIGEIQIYNSSITASIPGTDPYPTPYQLRSMVYQTIMGGSKGIGYYTWYTPTNTAAGINVHSDVLDVPDLVAEMKKINTELKEMQNFFLLGTRTALPAANQVMIPTSASNKGVFTVQWIYNNQMLVITANTDHQDYLASVGGVLTPKQNLPPANYNRPHSYYVTLIGVGQNNTLKLAPYQPLGADAKVIPHPYQGNAVIGNGVLASALADTKYPSRLRITNINSYEVRICKFNLVTLPA